MCILQLSFHCSQRNYLLNILSAANTVSSRLVQKKRINTYVSLSEKLFAKLHITKFALSFQWSGVTASNLIVGNAKTSLLNSNPHYLIPLMHSNTAKSIVCSLDDCTVSI